MAHAHYTSSVPTSAQIHALAMCLHSHSPDIRSAFVLYTAFLVHDNIPTPRLHAYAVQNIILPFAGPF